MSPLDQTSDGPFAALKAPVWRPFSTEAGHFLLHVPSSHLLSVPATYLGHVRGELHDPEAAADLARLDQELPKSPPRSAKVDIQAVSLNLAQGCNLRCTYCFAGEGDYGKKGMMSVATAVAALRALASGKERFHVVFFGGEPMLNFGVLQEIVAWAKGEPCRYTFSITTNGTLLTEARLVWLKEHQVAITLSYDGKGLQERQRRTKDNAGSSELLLNRKLEAFEAELQNLRDFKIRSTVTRENIPLLEDALVSTLNSRGYRTIISHHATNIRHMAFTAADTEALGAVLTRVVDRFIALGDYEKLLKIEMIRNFITMIHRGKTGGTACGAGVSYLTVSADGAYYLCHRFNQDESERYGDIEQGLDTERLKAYVAFRNKTDEPCTSCWMREWCAGGCFYDNKITTGSAFQPDPIFCQLQNLELTQAMRIYTLLESKAPHLLEAFA